MGVVGWTLDEWRNGAGMERRRGQCRAEDTDTAAVPLGEDVTWTPKTTARPGLLLLAGLGARRGDTQRAQTGYRYGG